MRKMEKIASMYNLSDEAKNQEEGLLSNDLYADNFNRKYPFHTKEACERSLAEYMYDNGDNVDKTEHVADRLDKAASLYGLSWPEVPYVEGLIKVSATCPDSGDILEVEFTNTPAGVVGAANAVLEFRKTAAYQPCMELAQGVLGYAFQHDCEIPDGIMKLAGYCLGSKDATLKAISKRASTIRKSELSNKLYQMAENILNTPGDTVPSEELVKIAAVLDAYDDLREDRGYTTYNIPPEQEIFDKTAFDLVADLEDELDIPSVGAVISNKDLHKNASIVIPILEDMGITVDKDTLSSVVSSLNSKQANYLFGELE